MSSVHRGFVCSESQMGYPSLEFKEPMANIWACGFLFLIACMLTPLVPENEPPLDENDEFVHQPATFNGLPWWAFKIILLGIIPTVPFMAMAYCLPDSFEPEDDKIMEDGMDPDAVMMTTPEMGRHTSYDERNTLIHRRRSTIASQMENLSMVPSLPPPVENDQGRRRLSALVKRETVSVTELDVSNEAESAEPSAKNEADEESNVVVEQAMEMEN